MRVLHGKVFLLVVAAASAALFSGCPLPFDYNGKGAGNAHSSDPSTPSMTAPVLVSYSVQSGASGTIADGSSFVAGNTTTVTLTTESLNSVIFYTDDGTALTDLRTAKKINASTGSFTITKTTAVQSLDIHAVAVGSNMLPSPQVHATVSVSPYPILSVTSSSASISEDGGTATFTVTSSVAPASDLTVTLQASGSYTLADETGLPVPGPDTATILSGHTSVGIPITGVHNPVNASHTVTLTIQANAAYSIGAPASASVVVQDDGAQFTLTVNSSGNGTTTPVGPKTVSYGVATAITAAPSGVYHFINWTVTAGSGVTFGSTGTATSTTPNDTVTLTVGNATIQANFALNFYVNAATGSDANVGTTPTAPFKTISKAISMATVSGDNINVAPGTYNTANGETFPLYIPAGVSLIGDEATKGAATIILGGGIPTVYPASPTPPTPPSFISNAVVMGASTVLAGFTVTNIDTSGMVSFPMGVLVHNGYSANNVIIRNNTIVNNTAEGIYVTGGSGGSVAGNVMAGNGDGDLVFVSSGGAGMSVSGNSFSDLVELDTFGPDLGGGAAGSPGGNSFLALSSTYFGCGGTVMAMFNHWNHNPPTVGPVQSGFDVGATATTVLTTGSF